MPDCDHGPVRLLHYDPSWPQEFQQTRSSLLFACEGWVQSVEHVGSTAISGLIARPTIDAVAALSDTDGMSAAAELMEGLCFRRQPMPSWAARSGDVSDTRENVLLVKPRAGRPTHRVFLMPAGAHLGQRLVTMRDWLRGHPDAAVEFESCKVDRWKACQGDPQAYAEAKGYLFAALEEQIEGS